MVEGKEIDSPAAVEEKESSVLVKRVHKAAVIGRKIKNTNSCLANCKVLLTVSAIPRVYTGLNC